MGSSPYDAHSGTLSRALQFMKGTHILGLTAAVLWALMLIMGAGGLDSVRSQHVPDFPSAGQIRFYIDLPAFVLAAIVAAWAAAVRWRWLIAPAVALITLALLALPVYLFFYMGGA